MIVGRTKNTTFSAPDGAVAGAGASTDHDRFRTLSVPEAGRHLGLGRNAAYAAAQRGEIPTIQLGKKLRVPVVRFERMLCGNTDDSAS